MSIESIEHDFHKKVCAKVRLLPEGMQRYRVFTRWLVTERPETPQSPFFSSRNGG